MTSLTPHRDAAERVIAAMLADLGRQHPNGAPEAATARVVIAVTSAMTRALADELDFGTPGREVTHAAVNAIGNAIISLAASSTGKKQGHEAIMAVNSLLLRITLHIGECLNDGDESKFATASVDKRAGRA